MAILPALALAGVPPVGLGLYGRAQPDAPGPWRWATGRQWEFVGVTRMEVGSWRANCDAAVTRARENGRNGVIIDPETPYGNSDADELAAWCVSNARVTRIGLTSFPSWGPIARIAPKLQRLVWGSVQLFYSIPTNAAGWARWRGLFGQRLIPSIAGYVEGAHTTPEVLAMRGSPEGYARYIASIPHAPGAIVWPNHPVRQYMKDALAARYGGPRVALSLPFAAASFMDTWPGLALAVVVALVLMLTLAARAWKVA